MISTNNRKGAQLILYLYLLPWSNTYIDEAWRNMLNQLHNKDATLQGNLDFPGSIPNLAPDGRLSNGADVLSSILHTQILSRSCSMGWSIMDR